MRLGVQKSTYYLMDFDDKGLKRFNKSVCMNSNDHVLTDNDTPRDFRIKKRRMDMRWFNQAALTAFSYFKLKAHHFFQCFKRYIKPLWCNGCMSRCVSYLAHLQVLQLMLQSKRVVHSDCLRGNMWHNVSRGFVTLRNTLSVTRNS